MFKLSVQWGILRRCPQLDSTSNFVQETYIKRQILLSVTFLGSYGICGFCPSKQADNSITVIPALRNIYKANRSFRLIFQPGNSDLFALYSFSLLKL